MESRPTHLLALLVLIAVPSTWGYVISKDEPNHLSHPRSSLLRQLGFPDDLLRQLGFPDDLSDAIQQDGDRPVGILENLLNHILQGFLRAFDPTNMSYTELSLKSQEDTDLFFTFRGAQMSKFSDLVVTQFSPKMKKKELLLSAQLGRLEARADNYTTQGTLKGKPYSATGSMEFAANDLDGTVSVIIDKLTFSPFYFCLTKSSLKVDFSSKGFEANFENADELNNELNNHGAELVQELRDKIRAHADDFIDWMNDIFCDN